MKTVVIAGAARTPMGGFQGVFDGIEASVLGGAAIKAALEGFVRSMVSHMANDPDSVNAGLNLLFAAKAIERIGAHAKNLAEFTIYAAKGLDVRHVSTAGRLLPAAPPAESRLPEQPGPPDLRLPAVLARR